MKTKRLDFNWKPLQINSSISVDGSVPAMQSYDADADEYIPDYTQTPCVLQPRIGRIDKDEVLTSGPINDKLTNLKWYQIVDGKESVIAVTNDEKADFNITSTGNNAGRIVIRKNAKPGVPINLKFYAEYTDPRNKQIIVINRSYQIKCNNATSYIPQLILDIPDTEIYNPLKDQDKRVITASLKLGAKECPTAKRIFVWEKLRGDNTYSEIGSSPLNDYDCEVSDDGTTCTVDRSLMGYELTIRCRAKYDVNGNPNSVALADNAPQQIVNIVRHIPSFDKDFAIPTNIPYGLLEISPTATISDVNGVIENPEKELLPIWYSATNPVNGNPNWNQVATGMRPVLSTDMMSLDNGGIYGIDVVDAGPFMQWEDSDGAVFTDDEGNILLIKNT